MISIVAVEENRYSYIYIYQLDELFHESYRIFYKNSTDFCKAVDIIRQNYEIMFSRKTKQKINDIRYV